MGIDWGGRLKALPVTGIVGSPFVGQKGIKGINKFLYGTDPKNKRLSNFDPQQQAIHDQQGQALQGDGGYGQLIDMLRQYLDPNSDVYQGFEDQMMNEFNEQTIPRLSEQFGAGAAGGALSSSGFAQALGGAGANLQANLAGLKSQGMQNALTKLLGEYGSFQDRTTFTNYEKPGQQGFVQQALPMFIKALMGGQ